MSESDESDFPTPPAKRFKQDEEHQEESSDEDDNEIPEQVDQQELGNIRQQRAANRTNQQNTMAAEMGIITELHLTNFMCHKSLHVEFGPRINFIIGRNGSGKSAILTGITTCLGGKASVTNRGSSLKELILKGESSCQIRLTLKNEGPDAYQPGKYGNAIIIVRNIIFKGGGAYKLMSQNGKLIATGRAELQSILDHMAIQPDNPMLILNQDAAKQFLQSSTETERYSMFMKGTQLKQLSDDYAKVDEAIVILRDSHRQQAAAMDDLKTDARMAKSKLKDLEAARTLDDRIQRLNKEAVWAEAYVAEIESDKARDVVATLNGKMDEIQEKMQASRTEYDQLDVEVKQMHAELTQTEELCKPQTELLAKLATEKKSIKGENKEIAKETAAKASELKTTRTQIKKENVLLEQDRLESSEDAVEIGRNKLQVKLKADQHLDVELQTKIDEIKVQTTAIGSGRAKDELTSQIRVASRKVAEIESNIKNLKFELVSEEKTGGLDTLRMYGDAVLKVKKEIEVQMMTKKFKGSTPVGPVGIYARLLKEDVSDVCGAVMGLKAPFAFIVSCPEDVQPLKAIFQKFKYGQVSSKSKQLTSMYDIYVASEDSTFDCSEGMPAKSAKYDILLDCFEFVNQHKNLVMQHFVNQFQIEQIIVTKTRKEAETLMKNWPQNVKACYDLNVNKVGHRSGGLVNLSMKPVSNPNNKKFSQLCPRSKEALILSMTTQIRNGELLLEQAQLELDDLQGQLDCLNLRKAELLQQKEMLQEQKSKLLLQIDSQTAQLEEFDLERKNDKVKQREEAIKEMELNIERIKEDVTQLEITKKENKDKSKALDAQMKDIQAELENIQSDFYEKNQLMETKLARKFELATVLEHFEKQLEKYQQNLDKAQESYNRLFENFEHLRDGALEYCNGAVVEKKDIVPLQPKKLQAMILNLEAELKRKEKESGSLEDAMLNYNEKTQRLDSATAELTKSKELIRMLEATIQQRKTKLKVMRHHIAHFATMAFASLLDERGYSGGLKFDHQNRKLKVAVQVEKVKDVEVTMTQKQRTAGKRHQDPKTLSGGEKSFSTVCLLLALWEAMGSTIRALDEFDVFMDAVNRNYSMKLIVESAQNALRCQYIMLTPQAMQGNKFPEDVKCIKIKDPERGEQTQ